MVLSGMSQTRGERPLPVQQPFVSGLRIEVRNGFIEPCFKLFRHRFRIPASKSAHIVIGKAAANDKHPFTSQRDKCLSHIDVLKRVIV